MAVPIEREPVVERLPGDFARHPYTGAPYVAHPTAKSLPTRKADLVALAAEHDVELPEKANVAVIKRTLTEAGVGIPRRVMYGRPSSLGKQIENTTNLQKWSERAVGLGVMLDVLSNDPELLAELVDLGPDHWSLDDAEARPLLDAIAVKAKAIAQAGIAAERGTHTHALTEDIDNERDWIERARSGEDLGIPVAAQRALVAAWEAMIDAEGIEILAVETAVVDDIWRQAGTLDRIARLTRERRFVVTGGEIVTLPAGWVGVLDVKTGRLRSGRDEHPDYWHGYAVQIASYAQSVPYDPDTDTRGAWEWPIDQRWGIIAHLDVAAAIDGAAKCRLVLVDLERGRAAGELCVAAREWEKSRDVFSLVDEAAPTYEIAVEEPQASTAATGAAEQISAAAPAPVAPPTRDQLMERFRAMRSNAIDTGWVERFDTEWRSHGISKDSTEAEIRAALDALEPPFEPDPAPPRGIERPPVVERVTHDDGAPLDDATLATLVDTIAASDGRSIVNGWLRQAADAGESWSPRIHRTERHFEISRAALALAHATSGDDDCARMLLGHVLPGAEQPAFVVGRTLGELSIDDAKRVTALAEAFGDSLTLLYAEDGTPRLGGDVQAVLAAA